MNQFTVNTEKILIVSDGDGCSKLLTSLLTHSGYQFVRIVANTDWACKASAAFKPDLIIFDLDLSQVTRFDVMLHLRSSWVALGQVPFLMITTEGHESREEAIACGVMDFIKKPIDPHELLLRVQILLKIRHLETELKYQEEKARRASEEVHLACREIYERLAKVAAIGLDDFEGHAERVARNAGRIASEMGLGPSECSRLEAATLLHDIGKIAICDEILLKPSPLDNEEMMVMRTHAKIGSEILAGSRNETIQIAEQIALTHHEKWDGSGYLGLKGESIPLSGRIVAVAEVMDGLTSEAPYKRKWSIEEAIHEINLGSGTVFDPKVVTALNGVVGSGSSWRSAA